MTLLDQIRTEATQLVFNIKTLSLSDQSLLIEIGYPLGDKKQLTKDLDAIALGKINNRDMRQMKLYGWLRGRVQG
jgi:hypothetical protein